MDGASNHDVLQQMKIHIWNSLKDKNNNLKTLAYFEE
jgi:hypothetical protein